MGIAIWIGLIGMWVGFLAGYCLCGVLSSARRCAACERSRDRTEARSLVQEPRLAK